MLLQILPLVLLGHAVLATSSFEAIHKRDAEYIDSPTNSYAPKEVECPSTFAVRQPALKVSRVIFAASRSNCEEQGPINSNEKKYITKKALQDTAKWEAYLKQAGLVDFDVKAFLKRAQTKGGCATRTLPNVGIAVSGGGERALLVGAGILSGFDGRNPQAVKKRTGGVLQLANYISSLSGGAWLVGSYATSNFPSFEALNRTVWDLQHSLVAPRPGYEQTEFTEVVTSVALKKAAGYPVSIVDLYGRIISYHFSNDSETRGARSLFSGIRAQSQSRKNLVPYPIIVAIAQSTGTASPSPIKNTIYEFGPFEYGTWSPGFNAFVPTQYMGTRASGGKAIGTCTIGLDNAGSVMRRVPISLLTVHAGTSKASARTSLACAVSIPLLSV